MPPYLPPAPVQELQPPAGVAAPCTGAGVAGFRERDHINMSLAILQARCRGALSGKFGYIHPFAFLRRCHIPARSSNEIQVSATKEGVLMWGGLILCLQIPKPRRRLSRSHHLFHVMTRNLAQVHSTIGGRHLCEKHIDVWSRSEHPSFPTLMALSLSLEWQG
jgi:hypothetical protein